MVMAVVVAVSMLDVVRMIVSMGMAVIVIAVAVAMAMVSQNEEVDGIDQNTHHGQNEHHCTIDNTDNFHLSTPVNTWT